MKYSFTQVFPHTVEVNKEQLKKKKAKQNSNKNL